MSNINTIIYNIFEEGLFNPDKNRNYSKVGDPSKRFNISDIKKPSFRKHEKRGKPIAFQNTDYFSKLFNKPQSSFSFS